MPAYTTIACSFDKIDRARLVREFYDAFFGEDVTFKGVLVWGCDPDLSLDQIVEWNQSKLDDNFILGHDQHVENDYRQIILEVEPFSECRLILFNWDSGLSFHCIAPEYEINAIPIHLNEHAGGFGHNCPFVL